MKLNCLSGPFKIQKVRQINAILVQSISVSGYRKETNNVYIK